MLVGGTTFNLVRQYCVVTKYSKVVSSKHHGKLLCIRSEANRVHRLIILGLLCNGRVRAFEFGNIQTQCYLWRMNFYSFGFLSAFIFNEQ